MNRHESSLNAHDNVRANGAPGLTLTNDRKITSHDFIRTKGKLCTSKDRSPVTVSLRSVGLCWHSSCLTSPCISEFRAMMMMPLDCHSSVSPTFFLILLSGMEIHKGRRYNRVSEESNRQQVVHVWQVIASEKKNPGVKSPEDRLPERKCATHEF